MPDLSGWQDFNADYERRRASAAPKRQNLSGAFEEIASSAITKSFPEPVLMEPYAVTVYDGSICLVHLPRAQFQIAYHSVKKALRAGDALSGTLLFPALVELGAREASLVKEYSEELSGVGFDISPMGSMTYSVNAVPAGSPAGSEEELLLSVLEECASTGRSSEDVLMDKIVQKVVSYRVRSASFPASSMMAHELLKQLFLLPDYLVTASGRTIVSFLTPKELQTRFK